jgi:hypothetical protein
MRRRFATAALLVTLAGCVGPARTFHAFEEKAARTAEAAGSAVETALLAAGAAHEARAFGPYLSVMLSEAEKDASSAQATFDSIQPPNTASDELRAQLDELLAKAVGILSELRIKARRGELAALAAVAAPLEDLGRRLADFAEVHAA